MHDRIPNRRARCGHPLDQSCSNAGRDPSLTRLKPNWSVAASSYEGSCPKLFVARAVWNGIAIRTKPWRTLSFIFGRREQSLEHEMTEHVAQLPNPDGSLLLRELDHRIKNELTSAICAVSAKAVQSDSVAVKAALLDVVDVLHQWADVHRALRMPDQGRLTDAARYLQQLCFAMTKYRLDCLAIRVLFSADDLRLEGERCWKLGLIVSELLTNVARHVQFDAETSGIASEVDACRQRRKVRGL